MAGRVLGRVRRLARSVRTFLPGFGTSGALLAGAAAMFVLASALVAFRGWPHVGAQPSPGEVVVAPRATAASSSSPSSRRLVLFSGVAASPPAAAPSGGGTLAGRGGSHAGGRASGGGAAGRG